MAGLICDSPLPFSPSLSAVLFFFFFFPAFSVLVMKNRGRCWLLLSNLGLGFCSVCGLRFLGFSSIFLGFFFLVFACVLSFFLPSLLCFFLLIFFLCSSSGFWVYFLPSLFCIFLGWFMPPVLGFLLLFIETQRIASNKSCLCRTVIFHERDYRRETWSTIGSNPL